MTIVRNETNFHKETGKNSWSCICDKCGKAAVKVGKDAGDAADNARDEGFTTLAVSVAVPMLWRCQGCKIAKSSFNGKHK